MRTLPAFNTSLKGDMPAPTATTNWHSRVWILAFPIILSNVTVPLVGAVDTAVMGHLDDVELIGAVALGASIFSLVYWSFGFLRMGTGGLVAQAHGAGDRQSIRLTLARSLCIAAVLGVAVILLQTPLLQLCLRVLEISENLKDLTTQYYEIRIWSAPATFANFVVLGTLIGLQRTGSVLIFQLFLNLTNIVLDLLFVTIWHWEIQGVATASVISEYAALALTLYLIRPIFTGQNSTLSMAQLIDTAALKKLFSLNANIMIRTLLLVLSFFYFNAISTRLGAVTLAANAILMQILHICAYALDGFAHAAETLAGHAWGSKRKQDFNNAVIISTVQSAVVALLMSLVIYAFGSSIIELFTSQQQVLAEAESTLPWLVLLPLLSVWCYQLDGIFIGTTHSREMRNAMIISVAVYVATTELLVRSHDSDALWISFSIFMVFRGITLLAYYPRIARAVDNHAD